MKQFHWYYACCLLLIASITFAQDRDLQMLNRLAKGKEQVKPEEMVSFKNDYPYVKAIAALSELAKKFSGKIIVDTSPLKSDESKAIGTSVQGMYWKDALEVILRQNENWYEENPEYYLVFNVKEGKKDLGQVTPQTGQGQAQTQGQGQQGAAQPGGAAQQTVIPPIDSTKILATAKEVTVSAILLEVNQSKLRESGVSFSIFRGNNVNVGFQFSGSSLVTNRLLNITASPTDPRLAVDVNAAIAFFENEGYGEVVSRPVVRVRAGQSSFVQVGQSFSINTRDFSNNVIQTFYESGTLLSVSPKIYTYNGVDFIDLTYLVDKSSPNFSATNVTVDHNKVTGKLLMLDGERTYVSGLITTSQGTVRTGVPFLKDLPWWVFGLRYIFGYDQLNFSKKELIVILDAKIEPDVEERAANQSKSDDKAIQQRLKQMREDTDKRLKKN